MEMVQCANRYRKPIFILILDFQKAFDTVNWDALLHILVKRGFPPRWVAWAKEFLYSSQAQMLINDTLGQKFQIQKGVRQGDPLSPYLFNLMGDVLQQMMRAAYGGNFLIHPIKQGAPLPVLQYADDTLLILHGSTQQATFLKLLLDAFASFSGLRINYIRRVHWYQFMLAHKRRLRSLKFWDVI